MSIHSFIFSLLSLLIFSSQTLFSAPLITSVSPPAGPSAGGTAVTITGSGFTGAIDVNFGNASASFTVISDNLITATSPAHSPQAIFITITAPSGTSPTPPDAYFVYQGDWLAYVVNVNSNDVAVINAVTKEIITTIPLIGLNPQAIAITPDGNKAYVTNSGSNDVAVINTAAVISATTNVFTTISAIGNYPIAIAMTPDGSKAYVANFNSDNVSVIDTTMDTFTTIPSTGNAPVAITVTPDGQKVYLANFGTIGICEGKDVAIIDVATDTFTNLNLFSAINNNPIAIAVTPDSQKAYLANANSSNVVVIDTTTDSSTIIGPISSDLIATAITPDGKKAYIVNHRDNSIVVIDTTTDTFTIIPSIGTYPVSIAITPDGTKAYVTNFESQDVAVIDTATDTFITIPAVGAAPGAITITPDSKKVYVANVNSNDVAVIDTATNTFTTISSIGNGPVAITMTPDQAPLAKFTFTSLAIANTTPVAFDASASISPVGSITNYFWDFGDGNTLNTISPLASHTYTIAGSYSVSLTVINSAGTSTTQIFNFASSHVFYTPFFSIGSQSPALTNNGGRSAISTQAIFVLSPPPIITNVNPNSGVTSGGEVVIITGMNFTGATAVSFGSIPAKSFTVLSDTSIRAIAPPGAVGPVDIRVTTPRGTSAMTPADQYTYLSVLPPIVRPSTTIVRPSTPKDFKGQQVKNKFATQTELINILSWKAPSNGPQAVAYQIYRDETLTDLAAVISANGKLRFQDHNRKEGHTYHYFIVSVDQAGNISQPAKVVIRG